MKVQLGICQDGNEEMFAQALEAAALARKQRQDFPDMADEEDFQLVTPFTYLEIGCNCGATTKGVVQILRSIPIITDWLIFAVDTFDFSEHFRDIPGAKFIHGTVYDFIEDDPLDFVFIDACHGKACVTRDFSDIEDSVSVGGIVVFHDASPQCQGSSFQEHCGTGIAVREALQELGLLDGTRKGWKKWGETDANWGIFVVQKTL